MGTCGCVFGWSLCLPGGALLGAGVGQMGPALLSGSVRRPGWAWQVVGIAGQWVWGGRLGVESRSWLLGSSPWSSGCYLASLHPGFHGRQDDTLQLLEGLAHFWSGDSAWSAAMPIQAVKGRLLSLLKVSLVLPFTVCLI